MAEISDQEKKIIRQIEYYFGDISLPRDRFLQDLIKQDEGWVTMETMTKFNRLKQICEDVAVIAAAMRKSTSGLMEVNEDGTKLRRSPDKPMPENTEERRQDLTARTVYAKPFPLDAQLEELITWFETYGPMDTVFMRKDAHKKFKGSVFATFKSKDDMEKFLKEETVKYGDLELEARKTKQQYYQDKQEERKQQKEHQQQKGKQARERQDEDYRNKIRNELTKGAMLHMKGFSGETKREDIKNFLQDHGQVAWIDFDTGDTEAWIRYDEENMAPSVLEKLNTAMPDGIILNEAKLECRVLEGNGEPDPWIKMFKDIADRQQGDEELERWIKMFKDIADRRQGFRDKRNKKGRDGGRKQRYGSRPSKKTRDAIKAAKEGEGGVSGEDGGNNTASPQVKTENTEAQVKTENTEAAAGEPQNIKTETALGEPPEKRVKVEGAAAGENVKTENSGAGDEPPVKKMKTEDGGE